MAEYIDKRLACELLMEKAMEELMLDDGAPEAVSECLKIVRNIPPVEVAVVERGRWIWNAAEAEWVCNNIRCGTRSIKKTEYCPHCGRKMDGGNG